MKKFVAILVSLVCILALLPTGAYAANNSSDLTDEIFENVYQWHFANGVLGYSDTLFEEGTTPSAHSLVSYMIYGGINWKIERYLADNGRYYVPASKYEQVLTDTIYLTDEALDKVRALQTKVLVNDVLCYELSCEWLDTYYALCDEYYGYKVNANGTYTAYLYRSSFDIGYITDTTGLTENVDYVLGRGEEIVFSEIIYHQRVFANCPVNEVYEATLARNASGELVITSYKKVDALPAVNDTSVIRPDYANDTGYVMLDDRSGYVNVDGYGHFPDGSTVLINQQKNKPNAWLNLVEKTSIHTDANQYLVFSIEAMDKAGNTIQPSNGPVCLTFDIPETFGENVQLFYVDANGTVSEIAGTMSKDGSKFTAYLDHFSIYVLADMKKATPNTPETPDIPTHSETNHHWSAWTTQKAATSCTEEGAGIIGRSCSCGASETKSYTLDHQIKHVAAKDATITEDGNVEHWTCTGCDGVWADEALAEATTLDAVVIPAIGEPEPEETTPVIPPETTEPVEPETTEVPEQTEAPETTEAPAETTETPVEPETTATPETTVVPETTEPAPEQTEAPAETQPEPEATTTPEVVEPETEVPETTIPENPVTGENIARTSILIVFMASACVAVGLLIKNKKNRE